MTATSPYLNQPLRSELEALCQQYHTAQKRFMSHKYKGDDTDVSARLNFDFEDRKLNRAAVEAWAAYQSALAKASETA